MSPPAQEKLAAVAARMASMRESVRALEQRAAALRCELERLNAAVEDAAEGDRQARAADGATAPTTAHHPHADEPASKHQQATACDCEPQTAPHHGVEHFGWCDGGSRWRA